jgi:hypothetical protein
MALLLACPKTPKPSIGSFTATPATVLQGGSATLSWTVTGATSLGIDNGVGGVSGTSVSVSPTATATYTLTATNSAGSTTAFATVNVLRLQYSAPAAGGAVRLVQNAAFTGTHAVLDLVVGATPLTAFGVALNLPVATSRATLNGLDVSASALVPTSASETAAKAVLPSAGPLAGVFVLGVAHHKSGPTDLDQTLAAGALLARFSFDLSASATAGTVFDGSHFSGLLLSAALTPVAATSGFALGTLAVGE